MLLNYRFQCVGVLVRPHNSFNELLKRCDLTLLLVLAMFATGFGGDYLLVEGSKVFSPWGFPRVIVEVFFIGCFCYLVSLNQDSPIKIPVFMSMLLELWWITLVLSYVVRFVFIDYQYQFILNAVIYAFNSLLVARLLYLLLRNLLLAKSYLVSYIVLVILPLSTLNIFNSHFWYEDYTADYSYENISKKTFFHDEILLKQHDLMQHQLAQIADGHNQQVDMYYIGFASDDAQHVFKNEVKLLQSLMEQHHGAHNRGMILYHDEDSAKTHPLAINHNLSVALQGIAQKMGEEDILFLYLTSHGSKDAYLNVDLSRFNFVNLEASDFTEMLRAANIPWKVIVVSACFSGTFMEGLQEDTSIVATAASATNTSFGCDNRREFTYYGEALLKNNLAQNQTLITALEQAMKEVYAKEIEEKLRPSNPQLWVGEDIKDHIASYEAKRYADSGQIPPPLNFPPKRKGRGRQ